MGAYGFGEVQVTADAVPLTVVFGGSSAPVLHRGGTVGRRLVQLGHAALGGSG